MVYVFLFVLVVSDLFIDILEGSCFLLFAFACGRCDLIGSMRFIQCYVDFMRSHNTERSDLGDVPNV